MIKLKLLLAAEQVIRDAETNKVSVVNLFDNVKAAAFPVLFPSFTVLSIFERDDGDPEDRTATIRVTLGERQLFASELALNFRGAKVARHMGRVQNLVIREPGRLTIRVELQGGEAERPFLEYSFTVDLQQEPNLIEIAEAAAPAAAANPDEAAPVVRPAN